jgi:hypothetical protein
LSWWLAGKAFQGLFWGQGKVQSEMETSSLTRPGQQDTHILYASCRYFLLWDCSPGMDVSVIRRSRLAYCA